MIRIVDYGVGNIHAFLTMFKRLNISAGLAREVGELSDATKLILPGVGAFDHAMHRLNASGMRDPLERMVNCDGVPILGVCIGMQMMARGSEEGALPGLGWIPGEVRSFSSHPESRSLPMPHMGWNDLQVAPGGRLFAGFETRPRFYFLHSYYYECDAPAHVAATASYGHDFHCAVSAGHIHGVQFHPEKSHHFGAGILKNFAEL
jgi:glutamine amidotransferase